MVIEDIEEEEGEEEDDEEEEEDGNEKEAELQSRDDQTLPEATEENLLNDDTSGIKVCVGC